MRHGNCEHTFIDARTGRQVLPVVNVLAPPENRFTMTPGRVYCCTRCDRVIDLRARRRLALPEQPLDLRPIDAFEQPLDLRPIDPFDPFADWPLDDADEAANHAVLPREPAQRPAVATLR